MSTFFKTSMEKMHLLMALNPTIGLGVFTAAASMYALRGKKKKSTISPDGKCVLITGSDSGFGNLLTHRLLDAGYTIVAACYTQEAADKLCALGSKTIFPVVALVVLVLAVNLIGDWLRDTFNPKLR